MNSDRARSKPWLCVFAALLFTAVGMASGLKGIDFGKHWDQWQHTDSAYKALETGVLLPAGYNYPSLCFDLTLTALASHVGWTTLRSDEDPSGEAFHARALRYAHAHRERLELKIRRWFLTLSLLTPLLLLLGLGCAWGWRAGLLAAACLASCHEFLYHARFIAPDTLMALCAAGTFACLLLGYARRSTTFLYVAAVGAGLTTSAKYTGVFMVLPVLLAEPLLLRGAWPGSTRRRAVLLAGLAFATFLATTPGMLLEPQRVLEDVAEQARVYAAGHRVYTVEAGLPHLAHAAEYLGTQLFSTQLAGNLLAAALGVWGLGVLARTRPRLLCLGLAFALPYLALLCTSRTFIVRNLMVLVPLCAVSVAVGAEDILRRLPRALTWAATASLLLLLGANAGSRWLDAQDIAAHARDPAYPFQLAVADLAEQSNQGERPVYLAGDTRMFLKKYGINLDGLETSIALRPEDADYALVVPQFFPATGPGLIHRWYGTREVNYPYYHSWHQRKPALVSIALAQHYNELE